MFFLHLFALVAAPIGQDEPLQLRLDPPHELGAPEGLGQLLRTPTFILFFLFFDIVRPVLGSSGYGRLLQVQPGPAEVF